MSDKTLREEKRGPGGGLDGQTGEVWRKVEEEKGWNEWKKKHLMYEGKEGCASVTVNVKWDETLIGPLWLSKWKERLHTGTCCTSSWTLVDTEMSFHTESEQPFPVFYVTFVRMQIRLLQFIVLHGTFSFSVFYSPFSCRESQPH